MAFPGPDRNGGNPSSLLYNPSSRFPRRHLLHQPLIQVRQRLFGVLRGLLDLEGELGGADAAQKHEPAVGHTGRVASLLVPRKPPEDLVEALIGDGVERAGLVMLLLPLFSEECSAVSQPLAVERPPGANVIVCC